jgi:hypothetical protein
MMMCVDGNSCFRILAASRPFMIGIVTSSGTTSGKCCLALTTASTPSAASQAAVLAQREMERRRSPLVSTPPFGRGFSRHGVFRPDGGWTAQERVLTPPFIVSMSPPGYPSAWLRPCSACFCFARQNHCSSATTCRFSTSVWPVITPEPRPARPNHEL